MEKIRLKDLRKTFYKCRDFELSHLWQRSVFLTVFLLACFTGYGHLLKEIIGNVSCNINPIIHELASGIAVIGIVFSIIWIMMAKASKAWYEVYENIICKIEREDELSIPEKYRMGCFTENEKIDSNLFSQNPGKYSPSKLNIFIGQVLLIIWTIIFIIHMIIFAVQVFHIERQFVGHVIVFIILCIVFIMVLCTALFNKWKWAHSSVLE